MKTWDGGDKNAYEGYDSGNRASGVVYALNLGTGERNLLFQSPGNVPWVSDPQLENIYYFDEQIRSGMPGTKNKTAL